MFFIMKHVESVIKSLRSSDYSSPKPFDFSHFCISMLNPAVNDTDSTFTICPKSDYHCLILYCLGPNHKHHLLDF